MGNLKKLLANKNVVTLLGVILIVVVMYVFYNYRINQQVELKPILYAKEEIPSRTLITEDMIGTVDVLDQSVDLEGGKVARSIKDVVGKRVQVNYTIPKGSYFYDGAYVTESKLHDFFLEKIPEGKVAYNYNVNMNKTYGNSLYPGNYVDIYIRITDKDKVIFGKYVENVKILAVKDSHGDHVFESSENKADPSMIIFAVDKDINKYLRVVEVIDTAEMILVPISFKPTEEEETVEEVKYSYMSNPGIQDELDNYLEYIEDENGE